MGSSLLSPHALHLANGNPKFPRESWKWKMVFPLCGVFDAILGVVSSNFLRLFSMTQDVPFRIP